MAFGFNVQDPMKRKPQSLGGFQPLRTPTIPQPKMPSLGTPTIPKTQGSTFRPMTAQAGGGLKKYGIPGLEHITNPIGDGMDYAGDKLKQTGNFLGEGVGIDGMGDKINDGMNYIDDKLVDGGKYIGNQFVDGVKGGFNGMMNLFGGQNISEQTATPNSQGAVKAVLPERPIQDFSYPQELMPFSDTRNDLFDVSSQGMLDSMLGTDDFSQRNANMVQSTLDSMFANNDAQVNRMGAEMGAMPGSNAYNMLQNQNKGNILSQGSKLLSEMSNRNIENRNDMLKTGATMGLNLDSMQRARKDQEFGQFMDAMGLAQYMPEDMVGELVKGKIGNSVGLSGKYRENPNQTQAAIQERVNHHMALGKTQEEAMQLAAQDVYKRDQLEQTMFEDYAKPAEDGGDSGPLTVNRALNTANPFSEDFLDFGDVNLDPIDGIQKLFGWD